MRRLMLVPAAVIAVLVLAGVAHAKKFSACPAGRFVVAAADTPLLSGGTVVIAQRQVTLPSCGATSAKVRGGKKFTTVTARWARCGNFAKVLLKGKLPSPTCDTLQATIKAKKTPARSFTGALSTCGDGFLDMDGGETCDASASGGDAACPGSCAAPGTPAACTCMPTTTSTTVTGTSTTSTAPECPTTTTIPVSPTCGNCTVDAGETCDDCNTLDGDDCPSTCYIAPCTPVAGTNRTVSVTYTPPAGQTVGGLGLFVDYPEAQVRKPTIQTSSGVSGVVHDRDYGLTEELIDATGTGLPTTLFQIKFQDCQCATPPTAADFRCTVEDATDENGNVLDPSAITCAVTVPSSTTVGSTSTSTTTRTTTSTSASSTSSTTIGATTSTSVATSSTSLTTTSTTAPTTTSTSQATTTTIAGAHCTPVAGSARTFSIGFAPPAGLGVAGITVLIDYPEAQVIIPGSGGAPSVKQSILNLPQGAFSAPNDLDYALREAIASSSALAAGHLFTIQFQDCQGATPPTPQDLTCTVEDASDPNGNTVSGVICSVSAP